MILYYNVKWNACRGECLGPGIPLKEDRVFLPEQGRRQIYLLWMRERLVNVTQEAVVTLSSSLISI